ncbi:DUF2187 domain-containing protein [Butyricicoccus sp. 1XD8-22]|nr:DUF2187 domain-containing protein [Butyricicoccus sp. 1XD8-22]
MAAGTVANINQVKLGQSVKFNRKNASIVGNVVSIRENTVMVEVCETVSKTLDISNNLTVVNHKHYEILET